MWPPDLTEWGRGFVVGTAFGAVLMFFLLISAFALLMSDPKEGE